MSHRTWLPGAAGWLFGMVACGIAAACPSGQPTALALTLIPGEINGIEHVLQVSVHDDGCLRVQRPAHWREPGRFGAAFASPSLRSANATSQMALLAGFDGKRVLAELAALERARGEAFEVQGADRYVLRWTDTAAQRHEATFAGVFQYAERYPEREDLVAFAQIVSMLQDEAARNDLVDLEAAP